MWFLVAKFMQLAKKNL